MAHLIDFTRNEKGGFVSFQHFHIETIICPFCHTGSAARVYHTSPFNTYVHDCLECNYTIMESEWQRKAETLQRKPDDPLTAGRLIEMLPGDIPVRALSWKQPYGTLMMHGKKETRIWDTKYRGYVLMLASLQPYKHDQVQSISGEEQSKRIFDKFRNTPPFYITGEALCIGKLIDSRRMMPGDEDACYVKYNPELYVHTYTDVHEIKGRLSWKGHQGWRSLTWEQKKLIEIL